MPFAAKNAVGEPVFFLGCGLLFLSKTTFESFPDQRAVTMLSVHVDNSRQHTVHLHEEGELSVGRQQGASGAFIVVDDDYVSRRQMRILKIGSDSITFENLGSNPVHTSDGFKVKLGDTLKLDLPGTLHIGTTKMHFEWKEPEQSGLTDTIPAMPHLRLGTSLLDPPSIERRSLGSLGPSPKAELLVHWLESVFHRDRPSASSANYYQDWAQAVVDFAGLDRGQFFTREGDNWSLVADTERNSEFIMSDYLPLLKEVESTRQSVFGTPPELVDPDHPTSLKAIVAAPIQNADLQVTGVLFGSRQITEDLPQFSVTPLEAHLIQLMACSVAKEARS